ncbi:right-handed parallel beta-helix repeat-containing protein [Gimesia panareensis]|uniref:right-handed parallel beta-helix repeat-containing protein n=1 Tax=Gimesia panareensis TaxID=2527978 RepID=UPI0018D874C4|nr:right-handed parallel beta-helix repeat-containing protein [Gimesia panareensis]
MTSRLLALLFLTVAGLSTPALSYGQDPEWLQEEDYLYRAYFDFTGSAGGYRDVGQGLLFVPLAQDEESLFFADLRGNIFNDSSAEGNFGLAYRKMVNDEWIAGMYGFYDVRRSNYNNMFRQGSFGLELMSIEWDFRVNGYIPGQGPQRVDPLSTAYLSGNNVVMRAGEERAYWGTDFEVGRLLKTFYQMKVDAELRGYVGGYYFDNNAPNFEKMTGPRARVEFRMFDLPFLGNGSRVVLAGQYQHDDLRGSQGEGLLTVRIPLPGNGDSRKLTRFQRRMVNPIQRDIDIVLNQAQAPEECARLQLNGQELKNITFIDANTPNAEAVFNAAGSNSVVLFDGSAGTIHTATGFVFNDGQLALAGGTDVNVVGCASGAVTTFHYGGKPLVQGDNTINDVFTMANNSTMVGLNVIGGLNGIYGNNLSGFTITGNTIGGAFEDGVHLDGDTNGTITNNSFINNGLVTHEDGLNIEHMTGGTVSGNTSRGNYYGFYISQMSGGTISNNLAELNLVDGFDFDNFEGGTLTGNTAQYNGEDGFYFDDDVTGGEISNNIARENYNFGFDFYGVDGGTISGNQAIGNDYAGFAFYGHINGGTFSSNIANQNDAGFYFDENVDGAIFSGNIANGNNINGFWFTESVTNTSFTGNSASQNKGNGIKFGDTVGVGTLISNNKALNNLDDGFDFEDLNGGTIMNNLAQGNQEDGFDFDNVIVSGIFSNNTSIGNAANGYDFVAPISGGTLDGNTAQSNAGNGFSIGIFSGGNTASFSNNTAIDNVFKGYDIQSGTPQTGTGTNTGYGNATDSNY